MNRFLRNFIAAFVILFISAIIGCNISAKPIGKAHKRDTCILQNPPLFNSSPALCKGLFPFKNTDYNQLYCAIPNVRKGTYTPSSLCQGVLSFSNLDLQQIYCALLADSGGGGGIPASDSLNGSTFLQGSSQFLTNYSGWTTQGNAGTTVGTNFIGTTDNQPFEIKVNNIISGLIQPAAGSKDNTGFGGGVFSSLTSLGIANSAFGLQALFTNTSGSENTGMGLQALNNNTTGFDNAALGYGAGHGNTTGSYNTYLGDSTGWNAAKGNYNIYIGYGSGNSNKSLSNNFYWGDSAGHAWTPTSQKFCGDLRPYYSGNYQAGSSGQVLTSQGAGSAPQWTTISGGGGTTLSGGSVGLIPFYKNNTSLRFQGWLAADTVNNYLGVGGSPNALLDIEGAYANYGQLRINATSGGTASIDFRVGGTNYWQQYATSSAMSFYNFTSGIYPLFQLGQYGDVTIASNSSAPQPLTITCNNNSPKTVSVTNSSNGGSACADQWWINDKTGLTIIGITGSHWGSYAAYPKNGSFIEFGGGGISAITQDSTKPLVFEMNSAKKGFVYSPGIVFDTSAAIGIFSDSLTVNGSTSGSAFFQQPLFGTFKEVDVQCSSLVGTATYTFPFPFKNIPSIIATNNVAVGIVTSISTTSVTLTGVTTSVFIELKGR